MPKKSIIILIPLITNDHNLNKNSLKNINYFISILINDLKLDNNIYGFFASQYLFSIFNFEKYKFNEIIKLEYTKNIYKIFDNYLNKNHWLYTSDNIDFSKIINDINLIKESDSIDKIYCFTISSGKELYEELKPYRYFEMTEITYRNIDIFTPPLMTKSANTRYSEKNNFYNIVLSSELNFIKSLFKSKNNNFLSKLNSQVIVGSAIPQSIKYNEEFVIYFSVYTDKNKLSVESIINNETLKSELKINLEKSNWKNGTLIKVICTANGLKITNHEQTFSWNGSYNIIKFDAILNDLNKSNSLIVKIDVLIEEIPVILLRPEIIINNTSIIEETQYKKIENYSPETAFASYSSEDKLDVISRISAIESVTGIDIFVNCLSILNNEKWKNKIDREIESRDNFWLFWSRNASKSYWVDYEWRKALVIKTIEKMKAIPLESPSLAPPPAELSELHFGGLREEWIDYKKDKL